MVGFLGLDLVRLLARLENTHHPAALMDRDLFGQEIRMPWGPAAKGHFQNRKLVIGYRKATGLQRCGNCGNLVHRLQHVRDYYKCPVVGISSSPASDIRLSNVCNGWIEGPIITPK